MRPTVADACFLIAAIRQHAALARNNGAGVPQGVWEIERMLADSVTAGHAGSQVEPATSVEHVELMRPRLVTYADAARLLAVSVATIKRRIRAGQLHPVDLGGSPRIRVAEIDELVDAASAATTKGA